MMTTQEIVDRWRAGETLEDIATTFADGAKRRKPVSRQAVSKRLIKAGYSPRERLYAERAAGGSEASAERLEALTERAEQRDAAAARLAALAAEVGISVRALVTRAGKAESDMVADPLADRVHDACAPFSPDYLAHVVPSP